MQTLSQETGNTTPFPNFMSNEEKESLSPQIENLLAQFQAQTAQLLAQSQPPSEEQIKEQREAQKDQAEISLKAEEMNIRKARFVEGVKKDKVVQDRLNKELQLKAMKEGMNMKRERDKNVK
jgi:hypothetical protein